MIQHREQADPESHAEGPAERGNDASGRSVAEWVTLTVSGLIVAALVGAALVEYFWLDEAPGVRLDVTLAPEQARQGDDLYYIPFTVENTGSDGAENVAITFAVQQGGETVEESTTRIAFLANGGTATGELVTAFDPASYEISARVSTFETP